MAQTALITGITGQVGSQLADYILDNTDFNVVGMMRWQENIENLNHRTTEINKGRRIKIEYADLLDATSIRRLIKKTLPDFIFHLAAQSFPKTSFDIPIETLTTNIIGTANLLETIRQEKEITGYDPVVHICSSSEVYGKATKGLHLNEDTPFHGASPYSISKIGTDYLGQFYGEAYNIKTFVTRMGTHSGPRRSDVFFESTVAKQIALIENGLIEPTLKVGNLDSVRTFQDTRDAVRAYFLLAQQSKLGAVPPASVFNIAGQEAFHLKKVVEIFLELSTRKDITVASDPSRLRPIDADYQMFDNTKIRATIDWEPQIPVHQMFADLLDHWRIQINNGQVPLDR
jgi:GDP-4-dehydro-6-deoxy-D-mannose reductase